MSVQSTIRFGAIRLTFFGAKTSRVAVLATFAFVGCDTGRSVHEQLATAAPGAIWDSRAVQADLDCDGRTDEAYLGHQAGKVVVAVKRAVHAEPHILEFEVGSSIQRAICSEPARIAIESLEEGPPDDIGPIDGYPSSRGCMGLELSGGECDNVHIFWNEISHDFQLASMKDIAPTGAR